MSKTTIDHVTVAQYVRAMELIVPQFLELESLFRELHPTLVSAEAMANVESALWAASFEDGGDPIKWRELADGAQRLHWLLMDDADPTCP